jgi:hypothetical protein
LTGISIIHLLSLLVFHYHVRNYKFRIPPAAFPDSAKPWQLTESNLFKTNAIVNLTFRQHLKRGISSARALRANSQPFRVRLLSGYPLPFPPVPDQRLFGQVPRFLRAFTLGAMAARFMAYPAPFSAIPEI